MRLISAILLFVRRNPGSTDVQIWAALRGNWSVSSADIYRICSGLVTKGILQVNSQGHYSL